MHEQPDQPASSKASQVSPERREEQPEFVGAPTEYADAAEVPEAVGLLAKILAGGLLTWSALVAVIGAVGLVCLVCVVLWFLLFYLR